MGEGKLKCGGNFQDELDAGKRVNQLCEEMRIPLQNPEISAMPNEQYQKKEKASQYKGVYWHKQKKRWYVAICLKEQKRKYGGSFKDELDAAMRMNQLCQELRIPLKNPTISTMPNQQYPVKKRKTSQYKGVTWLNQRKKWRVQLHLNRRKPKFGGNFKDELDAGKRVNQLCEEFGISLQNPEISAKPNEQYQTKRKISKYKGVIWHKRSRKWCVSIYLKGQKRKYGGIFKDELDAGKRVNQLCEELGIPPQNPEISAIPNQQYQFGGNFKDELDAAKRANQLCEQLCISPPQNSSVVEIPTQVLPHDDAKTIANAVICTEILKTDN